LLAFHLPRRNRSAQEIEQRIRKRHEQRAKAIDHHKRRQTA
jgi:hypothetical protein